MAEIQTKSTVKFCKCILEEYFEALIVLLCANELGTIPNLRVYFYDNVSDTKLQIIIAYFECSSLKLGHLRTFPRLQVNLLSATPLSA